MRRTPLISVITITLNDLAGLTYTVDSIENQTYSCYEHLVVDGGSGDGTIDFCTSAERRLPRFSYVSEKDRGIFDAMNKGARRARGDILTFVNSSDGLTDPSVLEFVARQWVESDNWQWGYGAMRFTDADRVPFSGTVQAPFDRRAFELGRQYIPHPASYVSRELFLASGGFDESFGTAADQEFFVRICRKHQPAVWIRFLADFMTGGVHTTESMWQREALWHKMRVKHGVAIADRRHIDRFASICIASAERSTNALLKLVRRGPNFRTEDIDL